MKCEPIDPVDGPRAVGGYTQGLRLTGASQLLFISGQIPEAADGTVAPDFESQCRQAWANVLSVLEAAGLTTAHLVKVTTLLADRRFADVNAAIRREVLGDHRPALTIIITDIFDERWLLEVEAVAAA